MAESPARKANRLPQTGSGAQLATEIEQVLGPILDPADWLIHEPELAPASAPETDLDRAKLVWSTLAPLMAGERRMRVSRDGGKQYRMRDQRRVTDRLPNQPAAILTYDRAGCAPIFWLDLDASRGGPDAITRDLRTIAGILKRAGVTRWFSDHSPNGGRHIYIPLATPVPFNEARDVANALARLMPTLDVLPIVNLLGGCLRPPGARHRSGGHQELDGPHDQALSAAVDALRRRNPDDAWTRLAEEALAHPAAGAPQPRDPAAAGPGAAGPGAAERPRQGAEAVDQLSALRGYSAPDEGFQRIARTGEYDRDKYATPSEARQAVLWAAAASGWQLTDVVRRLEDGTWRGLAALYARYSPKHRHTAIARDWRNATAFERRRREQPGKKTVRVRTTSPPKSQRGVVVGRSANRFVREWLAAVDLILGPEHELAHRAVLYAIAQAAALTGSTEIEFGNRHLSLGSALDQSTVGRILKDLADAPKDRALIDLIRPAAGVRANTYQLVIPALLQPACASKPWRRGQIHGIRPAFHELGLAAAFVYAALEQATEPMGGRELAATARLGVTATYDALATLSEWGLATRSPAGWSLGDASLAGLAEAWGIVEMVASKLRKFRAERAAWHEWLAQHGNVILLVRRPSGQSSSSPPPAEPSAEVPAWLPPDPEYDEQMTLLGVVELLRAKLGAVEAGEAS